MYDDLTSLRNPTRKGGDKAGDGVDLLLIVGQTQRPAHSGLQIFQRRPGVRLDHTAISDDQVGGPVIIMFVINVADHRLQKVFERNKAVDTSELVDDERHVDSRHAHAQ